LFGVVPNRLVQFLFCPRLHKLTSLKVAFATIKPEVLFYLEFPYLSNRLEWDLTLNVTIDYF